MQDSLKRWWLVCITAIGSVCGAIRAFLVLITKLSGRLAELENKVDALRSEMDQVKSTNLSLRRSMTRLWAYITHLRRSRDMTPEQMEADNKAFGLGDPEE